MQNKISVALTTYNGEKYLWKQLNSILEQTYLPNEIVAVDDCSSDKTWGILNDFIPICNNRGISYILKRNEKNIGYRANFKKAVALTTGSLIFLCDQDDIWIKSKIEKIVTLFSEREDVLVLDTAVKLIDSSDTAICCNAENMNCGFIRETLQYGEIKSYSTSFFLHDRNISPGCTMAFRNCIKEIFLDTYKAKGVPHDYFINLVGSLYSGTFFYNEPLINYRLHSNNTIGIKYRKKEKVAVLSVSERVEAVNNHYNEICDLKKYNIDNVEFNEYINYYYNRLKFTKERTFSNYINMIRDIKTYCNYTSLKMKIMDLLLLVGFDIKKGF